MFKDLRTGTKIVILCGTFIVAIGVTIYSLIAEKQIAIEFAKKELVGSRYLAAVREVYADVLDAPPVGISFRQSKRSIEDAINTLKAAQQDAGTQLQTGAFARALSEALRSWSNNTGDDRSYSTVLDVLAAARQLVSRIADDSNLSLDPDLDSYHLQNLITRKLPVLLRRLGEVQVLSRQAGSAGTPSNEQELYFRVLRREVKSIADDVDNELAAAYRGNPDASLKRAVDGAFSEMLLRAKAYLDSLQTSFTNGDFASPNLLYGGAVGSTMAAWATAQSELDQLLKERIDGFLDRMKLSLALTGLLVGLSIVVSVMTHQHIVRPLERLETVASSVRRTKDYSLRVDYSSRSEIGQVTSAFNDMLSELEAARERERTEHAELAHVSRLTTMGAMAASIAHEINQPLQAISANSSAAQRWLSRERPDLDEARKALKSITQDVHRAGEVIASIRAMLKQDSREKERIAANDLIRDILKLVHSEVRKHQIVLRIDMPKDLPQIVVDRTQVQQVFINLIMNAIDAMKSVSDHKRLLILRSNLNGPGNVTIAVEDSGAGIDPENLERIFDPFFTTKSEGMGLGLSICRSIVEAHGGRLWASRGTTHGSVFHVELPSGES